MRTQFIRMLVAFAMALLVPLQGIAGVSAGLCMELGHQEAPATAHAHVSTHDHGTADHHDHNTAGDEHTAGNAHCPPCVACCAAAAISSYSLVFIPEAPAAFVIAAHPPSFSGVQPETLDRPPLAL
jgi:hypothetical protein